MNLVRGYGLTLLWTVTFLALAFVAHWLFDRITPFSLRRESSKKNASVGHVLRGLYIGLAIILLAAIRGNRNLGWGLLDGLVGIVLMLLTYLVFDRLDRRNFAVELDADNRMLGMEVEGLFILTAAVVVGAMNLLPD